MTSSRKGLLRTLMYRSAALPVTATSFDFVLMTVTTPVSTRGGSEGRREPRVAIGFSVASLLLWFSVFELPLLR